MPAVAHRSLLRQLLVVRVAGGVPLLISVAGAPEVHPGQVHVHGVQHLAHRGLVNLCALHRLDEVAAQGEKRRSYIKGKGAETQRGTLRMHKSE